MSYYSSVKDFVLDVTDVCIFIEGFDDCIIGIVDRYGEETVALYDYNKVISKLMSSNKWTIDEAKEWFQFNIIGSWVGEKTPAFATFPSA